MTHEPSPQPPPWTEIELDVGEVCRTFVSYQSITPRIGREFLTALAVAGYQVVPLGVWTQEEVDAIGVRAKADYDRADRYVEKPDIGDPCTAPVISTPTERKRAF